jgi:hypothetical protein
MRMLCSTVRCRLAHWPPALDRVVAYSSMSWPSGVPCAPVPVCQPAGWCRLLSPPPLSLTGFGVRTQWSPIADRGRGRSKAPVNT